MQLRDLRKRRVLSAFLVAASGGLLFAATSQTLREPSEAALKVVESLRAWKMGVDRSGDLWAFSPHRSTVSIVSPAGLRRQAYHLEEASTVDIDAEWGAVGLFNVNTQIAWFPGEDDRSPAASIQGAEQNTDICWVGPNTVAVSPQMSAHRIEIWDLQAKKRIRTFGDEKPLQLAPGVTRMRSVLLRFDSSRKLLYTLESFTGDLQVYSLEGKLIWRARVENRERSDLDAWLRQVDQKAKAENDRQNPTIFSLGLSLAADGTPWVSHGRDPKTRQVGLEQLVAGKTAMRRELEADTCMGSQFVVWGSWLISYRDNCTQTRRWP